MYRNDWTTAYNFFDKGIMPGPGGFLDQPAKLLEAVAIIQDALRVKYER